MAQCTRFLSCSFSATTPGALQPLTGSSGSMVHLQSQGYFRGEIKPANPPLIGGLCLLSSKTEISTWDHVD